MIFLKTAIKNIFSEITLHLITILQMAAAMIITLILISSILIRYQYYTPLKNYFRSNGIYGIVPSHASNYLDVDPGAYYYFLNGEELLGEMDGALDCLGCNNVFVDSADEATAGIGNYAYTDNLIQSFTPELSDGRWLNTSDKASTLEIVISENSYGWEVGDTVSLMFWNYPNHVYRDALIVGKLKENAKIPGGYNAGRGNITFNNFFRTYSFAIEEKPVILMSSEYIENLAVGNIHQGISSSFIVTYPDNYTEEQLEKEQAKLASLGCAISVPLREMDKNSMKYLYAQMYNLFPIVIVLMILTAVGCISSSALTTRRRLRDYAIYYVNGLQWKHCIYINFLQSVISGIISVLISGIALICIKFTALSEYVHIIWGWQLFAGIAAVFIIYICVSLLMPLLIIGHNTPKQILTK